MSIKVLFPNEISFNGTKNLKKQVPLVEKPILYNNMLYADYKQKTSYSPTFGLFNTDFGTLSNLFSSSKTETKKETTYTPTYETKVEQKTVVMSEVKSETKTKTATKQKTKTLTKSKIKTATKTVTKAATKTAEIAVTKTAKLTTKAVTALAKSIVFPFTLSAKGIMLLNKKIEEIKSERRTQKAMAEMKLYEQRLKVERDLKQYKNLFDADDMKPSFAKYDLFKGLPNKGLLTSHSPNFGLFNIDFGTLSNLFSSSKTETKTATKQKTKTLTKSKIKTATKTVTKAATKTAEITVTKTAKLTTKAVTALAKSIVFPFTLSAKGIMLLNKKIEEIKSERRTQKAMVEMKLYELRLKFERDLKQYKNLFDADDMKPSFAKYDLFKGLPYKGLLALHSILHKDIERQIELNNVKRRMKEGADGYNGRYGGCNGYMYLLMDVSPRQNEYDDCVRFQKELEHICKIFISNSKRIEKPMQNFDDIIKNYFTINASKLQEIYEIENNKAIKILERVPKLGIIPKGLRVFEQWNLANCITKDFKDVTDKHVYMGIHPIAKKYDKQFKNILDFAQRHKGKFSKNNDYFIESMIEMIRHIHYDREKVYSILYDRFITGGSNIKKICQKTKVRGGASLAKKAIFTMIPFVC